MKKRMLTALILGGVVFAAAFALAAPLTVNSDGLGAGVDLIASCDNSVDVSYNSVYNSIVSSGEYVVNAITVSDIDPACNGQLLQFTLSSDSGPATPYQSPATAITGTSQTFSVIGDGYPGSQLSDIAIVISGPNAI